MSLSLPLQSSDNAQRIELEDGWEILIDPSGRMPLDKATASSDWRRVRVGLSWNVQFEDLREYMGAAWYRLRFELPEFRDARHVLLKFGAVDYFCEIYVNSFSVGTHEGGYTPFSFEITSSVHAGQNEMMIRVVDPPMNEAENRALFPEMMYNEIPHGKQNWYVQNSGIWQGVRLELCPSIYIERLDVTPDVSGDFELTVRLAGLGLSAEGGILTRDAQLRLRIFEQSGRCVFEELKQLEASSHVVSSRGSITRPQLWSSQTPHLYLLVAELDGAVHHRRRTRFGFRSFEAKGGGLFFNGKPFFMRAALDQDFYPETIHTPTSMEFVREMMLKAKSLGINVLRCHLKVAHPVYLDVADEVGMLIWAELPSWSDSWFPSDHFSTLAAIRLDKMFWEILIRDWNHPCIVLQTIINESWGINLRDASQRDWLKVTFERIKGLLKPLGRLVVDNSPCEGNFHLKSDLDDFHQYYSMPDHIDLWNKWVDELASRPDWTFSPYGDAERTREEPLLVSEFGNWGLPQLPEQLPWWFHTSFGERGVTRPAGVLQRFEEFKFGRIFESFNQLAQETQRHQFASLKYEIESIRSHESLRGYVITGITDVHWEVNGLLDMWRNEKVFANDLNTIQGADLVACRLPSSSFYSGEAIEITSFISHFSDTSIQGASLRWNSSWGLSGEYVIADRVEPGTVRTLEPIRITAPVVSGPTEGRLEIELRRDGIRLAENSYALRILPRRADSPSANIWIARDTFPQLAVNLKRSGFNIVDHHSIDVPMVVDKYDASVEAHLLNGGTALLIAAGESAVPANFPAKIILRLGTELDGRWFSNFNWICPKSQPFSPVARGPILGLESAHVAPSYVIHGIPAQHFDDVLSGITFGWLHNNNALAAQCRIGSGKLLITTYEFSSYGWDPYATELLNSLLAYLRSPQMQPSYEINGSFC